MKRKRFPQDGFTLIELMVVVAIIGLLVLIALPTFAAMSDRARISGMKSNAHTLQVVIESDNVVRGEYAADTAEIKGSDAYKVLTNPMTDSTGGGGPGIGAWYLSTDGASDGASLPAGFSGGLSSVGQVAYVPVTVQGNAVSTPAGTRDAAAGQAKAYLIFAVDSRGKPLPHFVVANGFANGDLPANAAAIQ